MYRPKSKYQVGSTAGNMFTLTDSGEDYYGTLETDYRGNMYANSGSFAEIGNTSVSRFTDGNSYESGHSWASEKEGYAKEREALASGSKTYSPEKFTFRRSDYQRWYEYYSLSTQEGNTDLFPTFRANYDYPAGAWKEMYYKPSDNRKKQLLGISDFTAGNTDRYYARFKSKNLGQYLAKALEVNPPPGQYRPLYSGSAIVNLSPPTISEEVEEYHHYDTIYYANATTMHKGVARDLVAIFKEIVETTDFVCFGTGGGAVDKVYYHGVGLAIDINAGFKEGFTTNPWFTSPAPDHIPEGTHWSEAFSGQKQVSISGPWEYYDPRYSIWAWDHPVVKIFQNHGWGWGGYYGDVMHFSLFRGH